MSFSAIHTREVESNRTPEKSPISSKKETEFASLMKAMSEARKPSREERVDQAVNAASQKYNLHPDFIKAVIQQESGGNPNAVSHCGAQGCMQLMPETAKDLGVSNSLNIEQNIDGGSRYLRQMLDQFNGDPKLALAAYNAGPTSVQKYGTVPPFEETQNYVKSIMGNYDSSSGGVSLGSVPMMSSNLEKKMDIKLAAQAVATAQIVSQPMPFRAREKIQVEDEPPPPPPPKYAVRV